LSFTIATPGAATPSAGVNSRLARSGIPMDSKNCSLTELNRLPRLVAGQRGVDDAASALFERRASREGDAA